MAKIHLNSINLTEQTYFLKGGGKVKHIAKKVKVTKFKKDLVN